MSNEQYADGVIRSPVLSLICMERFEGQLAIVTDELFVRACIHCTCV